MDIPASAKGYGAMYVPWFKVSKPSGTKEIKTGQRTGRDRRKLSKVRSLKTVSRKKCMFHQVVTCAGSWHVSTESVVFTKHLQMNL